MVVEMMLHPNSRSVRICSTYARTGERIGAGGAGAGCADDGPAGVVGGAHQCVRVRHEFNLTHNACSEQAAQAQMHGRSNAGSAGAGARELSNALDSYPGGVGGRPPRQADERVLRAVHRLLKSNGSAGS